MMLPIFVEIENKNILVVGGSRAAFIKIKNLIECNGNITVIAPEICSEIIEMRDKNAIAVEMKGFEKKDIVGRFLVIAAAENKINSQVLKFCREKNILCSTVDGENKGDFIFPANRKRGNITVAVSTNGKYPLIAKKICNDVDLSISDRINDLELKRKLVISTIKDKNKRKIVLNELIQNDVITDTNYIEKIDNIINKYLDKLNE